MKGDVVVAGFRNYADIVRIPAVFRILLLGTFLRIPIAASSVVITLHVVTHLHRSYAEAGMVQMVFALALAVSSPWRGRLLDRHGLRRTVAPSLLVVTGCWLVAPWTGYWTLVGLVIAAGMFTVPQFSIIRQVLLGAVTPQQRTAALAVDSVMVELAFMIGPVLGVLMATTMPTPVALTIIQGMGVLAAIALWLLDPPLRRAGTTATPVRTRTWLDVPVAGVLVTGLAATIVLMGTDLSTVAALRSMGRPELIGLVMALWAGGSAVGGIVYGTLRRPPSSSTLIGLLAVTTLLVALARGPVTLTLLLVLAGAFCAPTITATVDDLAGLVPASVRGEAMGWHGSALTLGNAVGAPLVGMAIDGGSWRGGLLLAGAVGLAVAAVGALLVGAGRRRAGSHDETGAVVAFEPPAREPEPGEPSGRLPEPAGLSA